LLLLALGSHCVCLDAPPGPPHHAVS